MAPTVPIYLTAWLLLGAGMGAGLYDAAFSTLGRLYGAHSTASGQLFHEHPAGCSMNIRPPREWACGASLHR